MQQQDARAAQARASLRGLATAKVSMRRFLPELALLGMAAQVAQFGTTRFAGAGIPNLQTGGNPAPRELKAWIT